MCTCARSHLPTVQPRCPSPPQSLRRRLQGSQEGAAVLNCKNGLKLWGHSCLGCVLGL